MSWLRDVELARDWLAPPFGPLKLLAPQMPAELGEHESLVRVKPNAGFEMVRSIDMRCRARRYWLTGRRRFVADAVRELKTAKVLHAGIDDVYRPVTLTAHAVALQMKVPTVFVGADMDMYEVLGPTLGDCSVRERWRRRGYIYCFDRAMRWGVRTADLAILKQGAVADRYTRFAPHPKEFCHTMYSDRDVISELSLTARLARLRLRRPLRMVYCGRFVDRKGIDDSIRMIAEARRRGVKIHLELIGEGPEARALSQLIHEHELERQITMPGMATYGPALLARLATFDAMLYTPLSEDTPRMLYDGFAAGLPVIAYDIPFVRLRAAKDQAILTVNLNNVPEGAQALIDLDRDRDRLAALAWRARTAGNYHAVENWYRRRAEWTIEAVDRARGTPRVYRPSEAASKI